MPSADSKVDGLLFISVMPRRLDDIQQRPVGAFGLEDGAVDGDAVA
jgi:hypothetical protein